MATLVRAFTLIALLLGFAYAPAVALAQESGAVQVNSGVSYEFLERWDVDRLNWILSVDIPKFSGIPVTYSPARNAVRLYRVTYSSVIPERGNKPTIATGLLAIPDTSDAAFPIISYQHGTVYGKQEVPSFAEQSSVSLAFARLRRPL